MVIYCIVGLPRSGSTFAGEWLARRLDAVNVGESWQTFRAVELVDQSPRRWRENSPIARERRAAKAQAIMQDPFWRKIVSSGADDPYRELLGAVGQWSDVVVDCSKVDLALRRYLELGCEVRVIHTVRPFSSWSRSMRRYHEHYGLAGFTRPRLLGAYLKRNRSLTRWRRTLPYQLLRHEDLGAIEQHLTPDASPAPGGRQYRRLEMFGAPNFVPSYDANRAAVSVSRTDQLIYRMAGICR